MTSLRQQICARSAKCIAAGKEPIQFPVVILLDNHSSRFGSEVHDALFVVSEDESATTGNWKTTPEGTLGIAIR